MWSSGMRVLSVEDDKELGDMIKRVLSMEGYEVDWVQDGFLALKNLSEKDYDLLLLDLMLPRFDGIKICKKVRESKDIPILVITARGQIEDKVEVLQAGADDYITKPFSFKELLARIQAVMRRYKRKEDIIRVGELIINLASHEVIYKGNKINLTKREFELLKLLSQEAGRVVSREEIYRKVWGYSHEEGSNIVDVYIKNLRSKLGDRPAKLIQTVRGYGYKLNVENVS
jgi:two-component system response regulator ArlR